MSDDTPTEREAKFDVDMDFRMPSLETVSNGLRDHGTVILDATYWDTEELHLSRAHHSLRRRLGRGWTHKGPSTQAGLLLTRSEQEWPDQELAPAEALRQVTPLLQGHALAPVARLVSERHVQVLGIPPLLEVDDDRVTVHASDGAAVLRFREVELELRSPDEAGEGVLAAAAELLLAAGARPHRLGKYGRALRALGLLPPLVD